MALDPFVLTLGLVFVALCFTLLGIQFVGWRWARSIERELRGQTGGELAGIILLLATASLLTQAAVCVTVLMSFVAREETALIRLAIIVTSQAILTVAFVISMRRARSLNRGRNLPPDDDEDPPAAEGREHAEGVGVEVDEVGVGSAVAVDHSDKYAPI